MAQGRHRFVWLFSSLLLVGLFALGPAPLWAASLRQADAEPELGARAAIVVEYPSGRVLYSRAMHDHLAPASTTKILTAILALEHGSLQDEVTVSLDDLVGESTMGLEAGERQTVHNLLYGMLLPSGNDAAMAVARYLGTQTATPDATNRGPVARFSEMMNTRVAQLGLTDSHFLNPHGLDSDGHYSSAYDLASLTWYALHFPAFEEAVKTPFYEAPGHPLKNTNEMLSRYSGSDGVKTGWTDAGGLCLVTTATRDGHRLISVVLNAPHWYKDSGAILDYAFARLATQPKDDGAEVLSIAGRGTAAWLLATATPPTGPTGAPLGKGGGVAAVAPANRSVAAPAPPHDEINNSPATARQLASIPVAPQPSSSLLWVLAAFAVGALAAGWLLATRLWGLSLRPAFGGGGKRSPVEYAAASLAIATEGPQRPVARTLGAPPAARRKDPNLLLTPEEACRGHIETAIALAAENRQGASMAEFYSALRAGYPLSITELDDAYGLTSAGFLALFRAQRAVGMHEAALDTLQYAIAALPGDRLLRLTWHQLRNC